MTVVTFFDGDDTSFTATYLVEDTQAKKCAIIDPSYNFNNATGVITTTSADKYNPPFSQSLLVISSNSLAFAGSSPM